MFGKKYWRIRYNNKDLFKHYVIKTYQDGVRGGGGIQYANVLHYAISEWSITHIAEAHTYKDNHAK